MAKTIAIFGAGESGQAVRRLTYALGDVSVLFDEGGQGDAPTFSQNELAHFDSFVFSPGFAADHPWRRMVQEAGRPCFSELSYAALHWKGKLVGITGTNGKTTLTKLLAAALGVTGESSVAAGNIGYPLADAVLSSANEENATAVVEISSFQAELSQKLQLDGLLWSNFAEDHLDRYATMDAYFEAKAQLLDCLKADAPCVVGSSVVPWLKLRRGACPTYQLAERATELLEQLYPQSTFCHLPNSENFSLIAAWWALSERPEKALIDAANHFSPAPHRLAQIAEFGGVCYWDDSKATNFHAALAAIESVSSPIVWIGGGRAKGGDLEAFAQSVAAEVEVAVLYGEVGEALAAVLQGLPVRILRHERFAAAVEAAAEVAGQMRSANVLLSPGFASFDQFESYHERGKFFSDLVLSLKNVHEAD
jgi:UDP-N-acetylmuramoylalanine--D-glutamate ligase